MSDPIELDVSSEDAVVIAAVPGEIDLSNASAITQALLRGVPNEAIALVIDLSDTAYLDSAGVRMLADLDRRLGWRGQALRIVAPDGSRCRRVLSLAGLDEQLGIAATVEDARTSLRAAGSEG